MNDYAAIRSYYNINKIPVKQIIEFIVHLYRSVYGTVTLCMNTHSTFRSGTH